jgi:hypothetical protein
MLQESRKKEKSRVTLTGLTGFVRNMAWIDGQIGLLGTAGVTRMDTHVGRQTGLVRTAGVTRTMT